MNEPTTPNYLPDVLALYLAGKVPPGKVTVACVAHDDGCGHWQGKPCDCNPEVSLQPGAPSRG